ncbi:hypothetical protein H310_09678 [Aphanomyces invadans]|uniref:Uncharacterized protein n=1 Tax=Aphanomyces invadans TaxID=157072 RepID=A0A024TUP3_9STRA|nr:hypothetical protein H310_09678 [Aphanomyces invadans]ETV97341.1 hypothetical protein H310_09678 [Aphanomyces invadans]|eukprot:XP_008874049.1 hypothetical protein H310_09678 [Aphanomyces invadans]
MRSGVPISAFVLAPCVLVALAQTTTTIEPIAATSTRPRFKTTTGDDQTGIAPIPVATQVESKSFSIGVAFAIGISVFILFVVLALLRAVFIHRKDQTTETTNGNYSKLEDSK